MIVGLEEEAHLSGMFSYKVSDFLKVDCVRDRVLNCSEESPGSV